MNIGEKLTKIISKKYSPSAMLYQRFECHNISFKTDDEGNPILLLIGERRLMAA